MHASTVVPLLQRWLRRACPAVHAARATAVVKVVEALLLGGKLTLTHLGRNLRSAAFAKHSIKRVDRLLGNAYLHDERLAIYRAIARWLVAGTPRPILLVDWADCAPGHRWLMLRAALPLGGRAIPVYEEVHPLTRYNSPRTHRRFLRNLRSVLPEACSPILVTDAGFRGPWFREVERYGWDWVGRVRNKVKYRLEGGSDGESWAYTTALYPEATPTPRYLGCGALSRRQPYRCHLYLVRQYRRGRGRPRTAHGRGPTARRCRKLHQDPWLLATSLPPDRRSARWVVTRYALRMKIEEGLRDTKNPRWGFALHYARSRRPERVEILLLIAALGTLVCWLYGVAAETHHWMRHFQANTVRGRAVLSTVFLGRQLLTSLRFRPPHRELLQALRQLPTLVAHYATAS
jgi:Transposase DDE domain